jgi:IstB-like ATP binding protein
MTDTPQVLLAHYLKALKLPTILREYDKIARQCAAEGADYPRYLLRLVEAESIERERRMVDRRIKAAKFPTVKSLDSFDFAAFPDLNKALVMELARSEYVERRENIIAVGTRAPARAISDWGSASPPARRACRSASPTPQRSCTSCSRPGTRSGCCACSASSPPTSF